MIRKLEEIQKASGTSVSFADLVVLGWRRAASRRPPRTPDSTSRCRSPRVVATPPRSRPTSSRSPTWSRSADGFRNYLGKGGELPAEFRLVDRANLLGLSGSGADGSGRWPAGAGCQLPGTRSWVCCTDKPGALTNDFFVNLLDMGTEWAPSPADDGTYVGKDRATGADEVDRQPCRSALRVELAAAGAGRGVRRGRRQGEVRQGLRRGVDQGDGRRPVRRLSTIVLSAAPRGPIGSRGAVLCGLGPTGLRG